jgi:hypothetical protein
MNLDCVLVTYQHWVYFENRTEIIFFCDLDTKSWLKELLFFLQDYKAKQNLDNVLVSFLSLW